MVHPQRPLHWFSPQGLVDRLNVFDDRQISLGPPMIKVPKRALWKPFVGIRTVTLSCKFPLMREKRENDLSYIAELLGETDEKIGYLFLEAGSVCYGNHDEDVTAYELLHLRLNRALDSLRAPVPLKIQLRGEAEDYQEPAMSRKDYARSWGIWTRRQPYEDIPTSSFQSDLFRTFSRTGAAQAS